MIRHRFFSIVMVVLLPVLSWGQSGAIKSVTIGKQVWMARNLDVSTFRNGDPIPEAKTDTEWIKAAEEGRPAWCYYNNDPAKGAKYGKLYNWYAVSDPRGLAPQGWHVPSDTEWNVLTDYLGGEAKAGAKMKTKQGWHVPSDEGLDVWLKKVGEEKAGAKLKTKQGWKKDGNGTNSSGFSGLPGGGRHLNGSFYGIGNGGQWWSSTQFSANGAWYRDLNYYDGSLFNHDYNGKQNGFSVRCLRD